MAAFSPVRGFTTDLYDKAGDSLNQKTLGQECFNTERAQGCFLTSTLSYEHNLSHNAHHRLHTLKLKSVGFSSAFKACSYRKEQCQVLPGGPTLLCHSSTD